MDCGDGDKFCGDGEGMNFEMWDGDGDKLFYP